MIRPDTLVALSALHPDPSAKVMQVPCFVIHLIWLTYIPNIFLILGAIF